MGSQPLSIQKMACISNVCTSKKIVLVAFLYLMLVKVGYFQEDILRCRVEKGTAMERSYTNTKDCTSASGSRHHFEM